MSDLLKTEMMPSLAVQGGMVTAKQHVEPGTGLHGSLSKGITFIGLLFFTLMTVGIGLIILLITLYVTRKRALGMIKGSGIKVGPNQFPEIHKCVNDFASRLGMKKVPDVYIVEDNVINAAAVKLGGRGVILLVDDLVDACLRSGDEKTLSFIIGHELAHHALGHTKMIHSYASKIYRKLARLDEFSCDRVARELVNDKEVALRALSVLLVGPQLLPFVNFDELKNQARFVEKDKQSVKAEGSLTHPLMLRRIARFIA